MRSWGGVNATCESVAETLRSWERAASSPGRLQNHSFNQAVYSQAGRVQVRLLHKNTHLIDGQTRRVLGH